MASGKIDWRITPENSLQASFVHSSRESFTRQNIIRAVMGAGATGGPDFTQGAAAGVDNVNQNPNQNTQYRNLDHAVVTFRREAGRWSFGADFSYSVGGFEVQDVADGFLQNIGMTNPNLRVRSDGLSGIYDRRIPRITAVSRTGAPVDIYDGGNLTINTVQSSPRTIENESLRAAFHVTRDRLFDLPLKLKAGTVVDRMDKEDRTETKSWNFNPPGGAAGRLASNHDLIATEYSNRWFFTDAFGAQVRPRWVSARKMYGLFQANPGWFALNETAAHINEVNGALDLQETVSAAYLRLDARLADERLWLVGGVRFEHTHVQGRGPRNDISATYRRNPDGSFVRDAAGRLVPITTDALARTKLQYVKLGTFREKSYSGYYPSLNASFNLTDRIVARAAYARTIGRPDHPQIIPNASIADPDNQAADKVITISNPGLLPWTANNYDFTLEAYGLKRATLSASVFQKDLKGFFSTRRVPSTPETLAEYGFTNEFLIYDLQTTVNGGSASVKGLELSYRQSLDFFPWGRGLQFFVNLTRLRLAGPNADDFTEFSPQDLNWGVTYGFRKFLIKVNTTSSDPVRRRIASAATATQPTAYEYRGALTRSDVSLEYQFSRRFVVYASIRNFQSAEVRNDRYNALTPMYTAPSNYQFSPTNFTLGVKGEF
jgi:TonB-dependent receptor